MGGLGYLDEGDTAFAADQEIAEYAGGTLLKRFIRLPGSIDEAFLMIDVPTGTGTWAHTDRLGSVIATTDSTGTVEDTYRYSPYGKPGSEGVGGFPFRFTGQRLDVETGLYYYKARYYDPEVGRFLQTDPIGYDDQMNLYAYVGNDPVNGSDPSGKVVCGGVCVAGAIAGGSALVSVAADYFAAKWSGEDVNRKDMARNAAVAAATSPIKSLKAGTSATIAGASELAGSIERGDSVGDTITNTLSAGLGAAAGTYTGNSTIGQKLGDAVGDALGDLGMEAGMRIGKEGMDNFGFAFGQSVGQNSVDAVGGTPIGMAVDGALNALGDTPIWPNGGSVQLPPADVPTHADFLRCSEGASCD